MAEYSKNILIVEDDVQVQTLYRYLLPASYQLMITDTVAGAKEILKANEVDFVILDLALFGDENGMVLARFIRQKHNNQELPIIAITAHAFASDRQQALDAGCNEYMSKPIDSDKLIKTIAKLIGA